MRDPREAARGLREPPGPKTLGRAGTGRPNAPRREGRDGTFPQTAPAEGRDPQILQWVRDGTGAPNRTGEGRDGKGPPFRRPLNKGRDPRTPLREGWNRPHSPVRAGTGPLKPSPHKGRPPKPSLVRDTQTQPPVPVMAPSPWCRPPQPRVRLLLPCDSTGNAGTVRAPDNTAPRARAAAATAAPHPRRVCACATARCRAPLPADQSARAA